MRLEKSCLDEGTSSFIPFTLSVVERNSEKRG